MKIGDVKVGEEYGAVDNPNNRYRPRHVRVVEIVVEQQRVYGRTWASYVDTATRNVRRVQVEFLDDARQHPSWRNPVMSAAKGAKITVEAKLLVAPWKQLLPAIKKEIEREQLQASTQAALESRLNALLTPVLRKDKHEYDRHVKVDVYDQGRGGRAVTEVRLGGDVLEHILLLAEKGLAKDA